MRILFITSEMTPFAKTGGLGDVIGSLTPEISKLGHTVKVFLPFYKSVAAQDISLKVVVPEMSLQVGEEMFPSRVLSHEAASGIEVLFLEAPVFFDRDGFYGTEDGDYEDNDKRFIYFQKACFEAMKHLNFPPDIFHCHDWQTGLIPVFLKTIYGKDPFFQHAKSIFTIHNLAYQGAYPKDAMYLTGINPKHFNPEELEFYDKFNFIKGGLVYADKISTVSEKYSQEIQTKEYGCGLEGVLKQRKEDLVGIINGIDQSDWSSETDPLLTIPFKPNEANLKLANKGILQKESHLDVKPETPVFSMVTRLDAQKGFDILEEAFDEIMQLDIQFVLLGTGYKGYHEIFTNLSQKYPEKFHVNLRFDLEMARRIYAGSDFFLMPSRYEPCGLGQLISFRYGTIPVVRATGGLADTVQDFDPETGEGNGFVFKDYSAKDLLECVKRAAALYHDKEKRQQVIENGMKEDYSWTASAKKYVSLYRSVEKVEVANG